MAGGGMRSAVLSAAHARLKKITDPVGAYERLRDVSTVEVFAKEGIVLDWFLGLPGEPDRIAIVDPDNTEREIDPATLKPALKVLWDELNEANQRAAGRSINPTRLTAEEVKEAGDIVTGALGYDSAKLSVSDQERNF